MLLRRNALVRKLLSSSRCPMGNCDVEKLRIEVRELCANGPRSAVVLNSVKKLGYALTPNRTDTSLEMPGSCMVIP